MSILINTGCVDSVESGVTPATISVPNINFGTDFRVKSETGKETILINVSTPLDQVETIRFGYSEIANVYTKSGLNTDQVSGTVKGANILAQINEVVKVTDTANASFSQYLPISAHLVIKVPQSGYITPEVIKTLIARLNATLYQSGASTLSSLSKGVMTPKGL